MTTPWATGGSRMQGNEYEIGDYIEDRYQVTSVLRGGMGKVYIALDIALEQTVAIKTIFSGIADDTLSRNFLSEAQTWILLEKHPHIVQAKSSLIVESQPYLIIEYIDGGNLRRRLQGGALDIESALRLSIQFCAGAEYAYRKLRLVHRDIKPDNLLLTSDGTLKIADFGLSFVGSATHDKGVIAGTPWYMSPEQWLDGEAVTKQSDIYSFGVVLYEMLTGRTPFRAGSALDLMRAHAEESPRDPRAINSDVPDRLSGVVLKCLEKNPVHRFLHYEDLSEQLLRIYESSTGKRYAGADEGEGPGGRQSPAELLNSGDSLFALGRYAEALRYYDHLLEFDPHAAKYWRRKAEALARLEKYHEAELYFGKALSLEPSNVDASKGNIKCLMKLRKNQEALACCNAALTLNPNDRELLRLKQKLMPAGLGVRAGENLGGADARQATAGTVSFYNSIIGFDQTTIPPTETDPNTGNPPPTL